ncbi:MAG: hypothetical protein ACTJHT_14135 [Sphingobacterium sp.]
MRLGKLLTLVVIVTAFASCGIFHKTKHKERQSLEEEVKRDCVVVSNEASKGQVKEQTIDKGKVVTERITTTTKERGGKTKLTIGKGELKPGENYIRDSAGNEVRAVLDTLGKTLTLELNTPPEKETKTEKETITEDKNNTTNREEKKENKQEKQAAISGENRREENSSVGDSESKPSPWAIFSNWIGLSVGIVIVVIALVWWFFGKGRK